MDAMISLQCASTESIAKQLNTFLRSKGFSTWICMEMDGGATFREEIVINASGSKCLIALMNVRWAESKECRYEFNIATRSNLTKGSPNIIPVILENFDFNKYPLITGVMANTNAIFYNNKDPYDTWNKVVASVQSCAQPSSPDVTATVSVPVAVPQESLPEKMIEWKTNHVAQWVQSLNLSGSPNDAFEKNWVDGPILMDITLQELQDSLKFTGLQAKRFLRELTELKNKQIAPIPAATPTKPHFLAQSALKATASAVSGAVSAPLNALRSRKGFSTGVWEGHYTYGEGEKDKMTMDVTMIGGVIAGYGTDAVGDFLVQGTYDDGQLSCRWDKEYVGAHTVYYSGKLVAGKTIKGEWEIEDDSSGKFELTVKKK